MIFFNTSQLLSITNYIADHSGKYIPLFCYRLLKPQKIKGILLHETEIHIINYNIIHKLDVPSTFHCRVIGIKCNKVLVRDNYEDDTIGILCTIP